MTAQGPTISPDGKPRLAAGVRLKESAAHGGWVLLAPERVLQCDAVAVAILRGCTGEASLAEIVDGLATNYGAPRERIAADVTTLLAELAEKRLIEFGHA